MFSVILSLFKPLLWTILLSQAYITVGKKVIKQITRLPNPHPFSSSLKHNVHYFKKVFLKLYISNKVILRNFKMDEGVRISLIDNYLLTSRHKLGSTVIFYSEKKHVSWHFVIKINVFLEHQLSEVWVRTLMNPDPNLVQHPCARFHQALQS